MSFFKKKRSDIIDLRDEKIAEKTLPLRRAEIKGDVLDFSGEFGESAGKRGRDFNESGNSNSADDFLSSLAGAGSSKSTSNSPGPLTSGLREARMRNLRDGVLNEVKLRVDDNEFKIRQLEEKIKELEMKLRERGI